MDKLFSEYIRRRAVKRVGGCERCKSPKAWQQLQCSHLIGRRNKAVRWDEDNAVGLCFGCHQHFTSNPLEHAEWFKEYISPQKFEDLRVRALIIQKADRDLLGIYLQNKLEELDG